MFSTGVDANMHHTICVTWNGETLISPVSGHYAFEEEIKWTASRVFDICNDFVKWMAFPDELFDFYKKAYPIFFFPQQKFNDVQQFGNTTDVIRLLCGSRGTDYSKIIYDRARQYVEKRMPAKNESMDCVVRIIDFNTAMLISKLMYPVFTWLGYTGDSDAGRTDCFTPSCAAIVKHILIRNNNFAYLDMLQFLSTVVVETIWKKVGHRVSISTFDSILGEMLARKFITYDPYFEGGSADNILTYVVTYARFVTKINAYCLK